MGEGKTPREVLDGLVDQQLMLQAAARDSTLRVPEAELESRVESAVAEIRANFPDEAAFQRALDEEGMSPATLRDVQRAGIRAQLIQDLYMRRQLDEAPPVSVTEAEMRQFYEERKAQLQARPELLTVEQVLVPVGATDSAWARAYEVADSLYLAIRDGGADFQEVARAYSEDAGSAADGGDQGWFRRGLMVREFERVAFGLRPGEMAPPVRTEYGWHVILTERSRPGEVKARHILIRPEIVEGDRQIARARGEEVAEGARAGTAMRELYRNDDDPPEEFERATWPRQQLARVGYEGYAEQLADAGEGDVIGPFQTRFGNAEHFAVVHIVEIRQAGEFSFEDLRDQIRTALSEQKKIDRILQRLRDSGYIEIRM
jgi:peptidyl-prolyl cis-trans isomerase SurA